jgi:glycerol-3-phosphate acyltransferase PlsX
VNARCTIALDAMGGDNAPQMVLDGIARIHVRHPHARFRLYGDEARLRHGVDASADLRAVCDIVHTEDVVTNDDKPSQALRKGRQSSMRRAIDAVAEHEADGVVSAGNTGALMAMSKVVLRTLPGIDRPAIASAFPTERGETVVLDLGANIECGAGHLVQFAVMGANFAHSVLGRSRPLVGLLNVGAEEMKGHETVKAAAETLRAATGLAFDFHGFVEGDDITKGTVDVVVTDGFTGNVALKASEGAVRLMSSFLRISFRRSLMSRLGYLLARPALNAFRERLDPRFYNGGVFLGLNGVVVKSHGGTDAVGFAAALEIAIDMVRDRIIERIAADFERFAASVAPETQPAAVTP